MTYHLGVDLGTTYTGAAVWRDDKVQIASLGNRAAVIPSVILLREDEEILTGEAASRRAASEPGRVAREFKRRLGDPTPIIIGGTPYSAASLMGRLLRWVVDKVSESEGGPPDSIAVSHPANWGQYKTDLLEQAIQVADLDDVVILTEPEAAAIHYASQARVDDGAIVAVYDLGGGTFDAAVLKKVGDSFEILGEPQGVERLGGIDFDEAVFQHVVRSIDGGIDSLDPEDPTAIAAVARLRAECIEAKEALSADTDASIPVIIPNLQTEIRITRDEFEHLIRPSLADSITSLNRALRSAEVEPADVSAVLLVGGSSRIPLVAQLVGSAFGRPIAVDAHPKHAIALGAAIIAAKHHGGASPAAVSSVAAPEPTVSPVLTDPTPAPTAAPVAPVVAATPADPGATQATPVVPAEHAAVAGAPTGVSPTAIAAGAGGPVPPPAQPLTPKEPEKKKPPLGLIIGGAVAALVLLVVGFSVLGGGDDKKDPIEVSQDDTTPSTVDGTTGDTTATTTPTSSTTSTTEAPTGPFIFLDEVVDEGGQFRLNYRVVNFVPQIGGDSDSQHLHFFFNTVAPENAGTNGNPPGVWEITDDPTTYLMNVGPADAGAATQICSVVATVSHAVFDPASGTCADLP